MDVAKLVKQLEELSSECERTGSPYSEGRAYGIEETLRELRPILALAERCERLEKALRDVDKLLHDSHFHSHGICRATIHNALSGDTR